MKYWLFKTEPDSYSIDDLQAEKKKTTSWDGVRNYQARNSLRDDVKKGDIVLLYHSNANPPGIAGICEVVKEAYPDATAMDPNSKYYDPGSSVNDPRWYCVDIRLKQRFDRIIGLPALRMIKSLEGLELLRKGSRLSIQPVSARHFNAIMAIK